MIDPKILKNDLYSLYVSLKKRKGEAYITKENFDDKEKFSSCRAMDDKNQDSDFQFCLNLKKLYILSIQKKQQVECLRQEKNKISKKQKPCNLWKNVI